MLEKVKKKLTLENLLVLYVCICPVLDIISFLYRNHFNTTLSPTTLLRPIIPCLVFIILFFKEKNKGKKIAIASIYGGYGLIHLLLFKSLQNGSSYGNLNNELQYIVNYSLMIINLYLFYTVIIDEEKLKKSVIISLTIYVVTLIFSIITKTSSSTYIEGIGFKGYFESGNSLCTVLLLSLCIILGKIKSKREWKIIVLIVFTGIYLCVFSGMRTGLFGFCLIIAIYAMSKFILNIRDKKKISKGKIGIATIGIIIFVILLIIFGSKLLERRKQLKQNELENIDQETMNQRYVTGDILNIYKQIKNDELPENYMTQAEKKAIINLCEYAKKVKLSNVNLRAQQFIYNVFLVKEQKSLMLILFGNGYKNQTGELVMEMEIPGLICNFGIIGFMLYFGPFLAIFIFGVKNSFKNKKCIQIDTIMCLVGCALAIGLSTFSGYVYFNFSSMTMALILNVFFIRDSFSIRDSSFWKKFLKKNCP